MAPNKVSSINSIIVNAVALLFICRVFVFVTLCLHIHCSVNRLNPPAAVKFLHSFIMHGTLLKSDTVTFGADVETVFLTQEYNPIGTRNTSTDRDPQLRGVASLEGRV